MNNIINQFIIIGRIFIFKLNKQIANKALKEKLRFFGFNLFSSSLSIPLYIVCILRQIYLHLNITNA
jgi:hypothetical protein